MIEHPIYKKLSSKLFDLFYVDDNKYGRQNDNGTYRLIRYKITPATIDDMLLKQKSLLTYQEIHTLQHAFIKWICLDLDIAKAAIGDEEVKESDLRLVKKSADKICYYLKKEKIPYLLEFSGRRGFHVWIIFDELQTKADGYKLVKLIRSKVVLEDNINVDLFPKTHAITKGSKMVGLGVKLPLSQNKTSGKLSFFLNEKGDFNFNKTSHPAEVDESFLEKQFKIISKYHLVDSATIRPYLEEFDQNQPIDRSQLAFLRNIKVESPLRTSSNLEGVLASLKKCEHISTILENYQQGLSSHHRSLMVGLLGQLKSDDDPKLGYHLLNEFFSQIQGYRKELTEQKLKLAEYYFPVSCNYLGRCKTCNCDAINSPIQLIEGIELTPRSTFEITNISKEIFETIVAATKRYSHINDEIPLYNQLKKLDHISQEKVEDYINQIFEGRFPDVNEVFKFERNEVDKVRVLYNIDHVTSVVSTYFLFVLNNLFYSEISQNSFGYRVAPGFYNANIFSNWFVSWSIFSKNVQQILEGEEYESYYVIKIDIKSFYDRVDLQRLQIKLYEEAPIKIDAKIKSLDDDSRYKYQNIIKYLLKIARQTTGNPEKGLPQGPAFARYLAELYLIGLDRLIEQELIKDKRREFYYRFVDDIFIFVESEHKAKEVLKNVQKWVSVNSLELNPSKTEVSNVHDYFISGKFKRFQDDAKYSINKANKNKNLLSEIEIQEAVAKLDGITNDAKFGIKDNIRFFYYQFSGDSRLKHIRAKLAGILPFSSSGRGTLFMLFYNDLYDSQPDIFWGLTKQQERITGLSLGQYLNTILLKDSSLIEHAEIIDSLLSLLGDRSDLNNVHRSLILTLYLKYKLKIPSNFLSQCSKNLIHSAMETPEIAYTEDNYPVLEQMLSEKDKVDFISTVYQIVTAHPMAIEVTKNLAKYAFARFSEWRDSDEMTEKLKEPTTALEYYHCLCFLTLFEHSDDPSALTVAWENLLKVSNDIELDGKKISFDWINNAIENYSGEFSSSSYHLLLAKKEGSELNKFICKHKFIDLFLEVLVIFHFAKNLSLEMFQEESQSIIDKDSIFGKWLVDGNARLYPMTDMLCVKNLALNGLIVLTNDTHVFIKNINEELPLERFGYLKISPSVDRTECEITKTDSVKLDIYDQAPNFSVLLYRLSDRIRKDEEFKNEFKTNHPVYYNHPYLVRDKTLIPFYSVFEKKVSVTGVSQKNDAKGYWENLFALAQDFNPQTHALSDTDNPFNFKFSALNDRFFPKSETILNTDEEKLGFIVAFAQLSKQLPIQDAFHFHYLWLQTVWSFVEQSSVNINDKFNLLLNIHFAQFAAEPEVAYDVLFATDYRTQLKNNSLLDFLDTIRSSLIMFQNEVILGEFNIVSLFDDESKMFSDVAYDALKLRPKDFLLMKLEFSQYFNLEKQVKDVKVHYKTEDLTLLPVYLYDRSTSQFWSKTFLELQPLVNMKRYYVHKNENGIWVYIIEFEISKAYDRICERRTMYENIKSVVRFKKVFPKDKIYLAAKKEYDEYQAANIEKALNLHYWSTTDIKERIINWLSIFNDESIKDSELANYMLENKIEISKLYRAIMEVILIHKSLNEEDIENFKKTILEHITNGDLIFPLKHPGRDENGLQRLINKANFPPRTFDFDSNANALFTSNLEGRKIILVADLTITGDQMIKALDYYSQSFDNLDQLNEINKNAEDKNLKYFKYSSINEAETCIQNFKDAKEIVILSPMITKVFIDAIKRHPLLADKTITIKAMTTLTGKEYLFEDNSVSEQNKSLFEVLIKDHNLIKRLFEIPTGLKYKNSVKHPGKLNVLLRVGSLPNKHIRLFSLKSKNGGLTLFDYIKNWGLT